MKKGRTGKSEQIRAIIRRALEIDEADAYDPGIVAEIAAELGISEAAVTRALREHEAAEAQKTSTSKGLRRWLRPGVLLAASTGLGVALKVLRVMAPPGGVHTEALIGVSALAATAFGLAVYHRTHGEQKSFQLDNAMLWTGLVIGWCIPSLYMVDDILGAASAFLAGSAVVGFGIVRYKNGRLKKAEDSVEYTAAEDRGGQRSDRKDTSSKGPDQMVLRALQIRLSLQGH